MKSYEVKTEVGFMGCHCENQRRALEAYDEYLQKGSALLYETNGRTSRLLTAIEIDKMRTEVREERIKKDGPWYDNGGRSPYND